MWVSPGAARTELGGVADGHLRVRLAARAVHGHANEALVRYVAELLGIRRGDVSLVAGARSRRKLLRLSGVTLPEAERRLGI